MTGLSSKPDHFKQLAPQRDGYVIVLVLGDIGVGHILRPLVQQQGQQRAVHRYPDRLWTLVERWIERGQCRHIVCTLKFQGETDFTTMARFGAVPGSSLRHLSCNRHELTWEWHR